MDAPRSRLRFPGPGALFAIYLGIGIALRVGVEIYVRFIKADYGGPDSIAMVMMPQLPLSDRIGALVALWIVPVLAWPLIVLSLVVNWLRNP